MVTGSIVTFAGCAPAADDPANPPRLGLWRDQTQVIGVTLDDRSVPLSELRRGLTDQLNAAVKDEQLCGEPRLRDREEATRLISARIPDCSVEQWTHDGHAVSGLARCTPRKWGATEVTPTVRAEGSMGETYVRLDIQTIARIPEPSGNTHSAVIKLRRTIERLGDC